MDENHDILQDHRNRVIHRRWKIVRVTLLIALVAAGIFVFNLDQSYVGRAKLQLRLDAPSDLSELQRLDFLHKTLREELTVISSHETLLPVVEGLNLRKKWNLRADENAPNLKLSRMIEARLEQGTNILTIEVYGDNAREAAELANAVTDSYAQRRSELEKSRTQSAIRALEKELQDQKPAIDAKGAEMLRVMEANVSNQKPYLEALTPPLQIVERAMPDSASETRPNLVVILTFTILGGLVLGRLLATLLEGLWPTPLEPKGGKGRIRPNFEAAI